MSAISRSRQDDRGGGGGGRGGGGGGGGGRGGRREGRGVESQGGPRGYPAKFLNYNFSSHL